MGSDRDYIVEISGLEGAEGSLGGSSAKDASGAEAGKPWLSVFWKCCHTYSRVYRNRKGDAYEGRCPKCGSPVRATIGPGGVSTRFFTAE